MILKIHKILLYLYYEIYNRRCKIHRFKTQNVATHFGYCEDCELCVWCHHLTSCIFCCACYDLFNCLDCYEIEGYDNVEGNGIDNEEPLKLKFTKDGKDIYKLYKNELFMLDDNPSFDDTFNGDFDDEYEEIFGPNLLRKYFE